MLTFKLISYIDGFYHYEIYPEGRVQDKGWIVFNPDTGTLKEQVKPSSPFSTIMCHFLSGVKDKNGNFKESGMVAWY